jgi:hypothetical protein
MTNLADLDRALAAFLEDGPNAAPEAPIIAAMAHARTTPRRPDLLRAFRSDVMAPRRAFNGRGVAALGLATLLMAGLGVAVIGSRPTNPAVVPPSDSVLPTQSGQPSPSLAPLQSPAPSEPATPGPHQPLGSPAVPPIHVALRTTGGNPASVDVVDESGMLANAVSGNPPENVDQDGFRATNDDPTTVRLTWVGSPCDTVHRLTIDSTLATLTLDRPRCGGDAVPVFRELILRFSRPVDATTLTTTLYDGRGGVDMPTWTASAPDSGSGGYDIVVADPGYVVESVEGSFDPEVEAVGAGPTGIQLVATSDTALRLIWRGPACATTPSLEIDPTGDHWRLLDDACTASGSDVLRMIDVSLADPRPAGSLPTIEAITVP